MWLSSGEQSIQHFVCESALASSHVRWRPYVYGCQPRNLMKVFLEHRGSTNFSQKFEEQSRDQDFFIAMSHGIYKNTRAEAKYRFLPASDSEK